MCGSRMKDLCISFKAFLLALCTFDECFNNVLLTLLPSYHTVISVKGYFHGRGH